MQVLRYYIKSHSSIFVYLQQRVNQLIYKYVLLIFSDDICKNAYIHKKLDQIQLMYIPLELHCIVLVLL